MPVVNIQAYRKYLLVAAVILLLLAVSLFWLVTKNKIQPLNLINAKTYQMQATKDEKGTGLSFLLPNKFSEAPGGSDYSKIFIQKNSSGKVVRSIFAIRRLFSINTPIQTENNAFKGAPSLVSRSTSVNYYNKSSPNFQAFDFKSTIKSTSPTIKPSEVGIKPVNELIENYSLKAKDASPSEVDETLKFNLSKNSSYYLIISSTSKSWQKDQPAWLKVLDSLKIDQ